MSSRRAVQRAAVAAAEKRAAKAAKLALALAWQAFPTVISDEFLAAVERGETGAAQAALRMPPRSSVMPAIRAAQRAGWQAGIKEGKAALPELFDDEPVRPSPGNRKAQRVLARDYRSDRDEIRQARNEARAFLKSFMRAVRDQVSDDLGRARDSADPEGGFRDGRHFLEDIKAGRELSPRAKQFVRGVEKRAERVIATPLLEVDWRAARRAEVTTWRSVSTPKGSAVALEFVATNDDATTPACQFLDGAKMDAHDPRADAVRPGIHYRCRSVFVPVMVDSAKELTWDERVTKAIGEPNASGSAAVYTLRPSQIRVPASAPNVAPPRRLAEWVG